MYDIIDIVELNEKIDKFLNNRRTTNKDLTYTYRKSNYGGRLDEGYWFYGNESYLALSFWSGMDWKNKTPNIIFCVTERGDIWLEINVSDSDRKREFIEQYVIQEFNFDKEGRRYKKILANNCNLDQSINRLEEFLDTLKNDLDKIILIHSENFFLENENSIAFISRKEFSERQRKINRYKEKLEEDHAETPSNYYKPHKIKSFKLWDYGPIEHIEMEGIPENNQWIFITGENGSGKTNLLRAMGSAFGYRTINKDILNKHPHFKVEAKLYSNYQEIAEPFERIGNVGTSNRRPKLSGLCMYGPYRLMNSHKLAISKFKLLYKKAGTFQSLFSDVSPLLDLEKQFGIWKKNKKYNQFFEKRQYYIQSILTDVVPGLYDIRFELKDAKGKRTTRYITRKNENEDEIGVLWYELSSGTKSVFSLIVDIMLRLYEQQPKTVDPSELKGVVLIDEIDLHLHPKAQKQLIINLSKTFREVQFIATTHSPIPLLGAPRNSRIYVMKEIDDIIKLIRMDDKVMFSKILPNALLSSPIFDLDELIPESKNKDEIPYLDEKYERVVFLDKLETEINDYLTNSRQKELMRLFTNIEEG